MFKNGYKEPEKDAEPELLQASMTSEADSEAATVGSSDQVLSDASPKTVDSCPGNAGKLVQRARRKCRAVSKASSQGVTQLSRVDGAETHGDSVRLAASLALAELGEPDEPVMLMDLSKVSQRLAEWRRHLPRVTPHYAVKCNPDRKLLQRLKEGGSRFDCATMGEVQRVLSLGAEPEDLVFSHPCKLRSHLRFCKTKNVNLMTFDNEAELQKVASEFPSARLLLRLVCEDSTAQCPMSLKFGAVREEWAHLLGVVRALGLNAVGVSFHVGSGCKEPANFKQALQDASDVFALAKEHGFDMDLLDIGGGFPGESNCSDSNTFAVLASVINENLEKYFAQDSFPTLRVIAEPGRFLACSAVSLLTKVFAKAEVPAAVSTQSVDEEPAEQSTFRYYINDGLYGSFNCILYDHAVVTPEILAADGAVALHDQQRHCCLFGPTCDGFDVVMKDCVLPELHEGDWLLWRNMGAYTSAAGSKFNGFPQPKVWYYDESFLSPI